MSAVKFWDGVQWTTVTGAKGDTGAQGPQGDVGPKGDPGDDGAAGPIGSGTMEPWHLVGAVGEPAFEHNWVNLGGTFATAAFRKDPLGRVLIRGSIASGTLGQSAFTLPPGYRPTKSLRFTTLGPSISAASYGAVSITSAGVVTVFGDANGTLTFDGVFFDTDTVSTYLTGPKGDSGDQGVQGIPGIPGGPPGPTGPKGDKGDVADPIPIDAWHLVGDATTGLGTAFSGAWTNYDAGVAFTALAFRKDPFGKVQIRGSVKGTTSGTALFTLPAGYRPTKTHRFDTRGSVQTSAAFVQVNVEATGLVTIWGDGPTAILSLDGIEFDTDTVTTFPAGPKGDKGDQGPIGTTPAHGPKTVRGLVNADGSILLGSGFTVSKPGAGIYTISFTTPMSVAPSVDIIPIAGVSNFSARIDTSFPTVNGFGVRTVVANTNTANDAAFSFFAIEVGSGEIGAKGDPGAAGAQGIPGIPADPTPLDSWHQVGAVGEPAYQNSAVAYSGGSGVVKFRKDPLGYVIVEGLIKSGADGSTVFTLPAGYRPAGTQEKAFIIRASGGFAVALVRADGQVQLTGVSGIVTTWAYLDSIQFDTETVTTFPIGPIGPQGVQGVKGDAADPTPLDSWHQVGAVGEPAFVNSWINYGAGQETAAFTKDPFGRVRLRGLIKGGTIPATAFTLPAGYRPPSTSSGGQRFPVISGSGTGYVVLLSDGTVSIQAPSVIANVDLSSIEFDTATVTTFPVGPRGLVGPKGDAADPTPLDVWHNFSGVGGDGGFFNTTVNFDNNANVPSATPTHRNAAYRKFMTGKVRLKGVIKCGANAVQVLQVPSAYRPPQDRTFVVSASGGPAIITVQANGAIFASNSTGVVTTWMYLDGVEYDAEDVLTFPTGPRGVAGPSGSTSYNLPTARVATTGNLNLASPGAVIDGIGLVNGDIVLAWLQTNPVENGAYMWTGPGTPLTRITAAAAGMVLLTGTRIYVTEGTLFGQRDFYLKVSVTIGSGSPLFSPPRGAIIREWRVSTGPGETVYALATLESVVTDSTGAAVQIVYTPPVDIWLETVNRSYVSKEDAVYGYAYGMTRISPNDADGKDADWPIIGGMRIDVNRYFSFNAVDKWRLVAGTTYTLSMRMYTSITGFSFQRGLRYSFLLGTARVR